MADLFRLTLAEREVEQAITALKRGAYLLKYGRRGKPKFCPFRLSPDETKLIWYYGDEEKHLDLRHVSRIIPGQRTAIFQRYPRPEKEYQSFSLLYDDRSLDLICKDKDEAEVWFMGLKAIIARGSYQNLRNGSRTESLSSESPRGQRISLSSQSFCPSPPKQGSNVRNENPPNARMGKAFADIVSLTATTKTNTPNPSVSLPPSASVEQANGRSSDAFRTSLSSAVSSSSQDSCNEDTDSMGDVFIWGEGTGDQVLGGRELGPGRSSTTKADSHLPKALVSAMVLDVRSIACGSRHAVLVTKHGEIFSWGEEVGGRLGHGVEADISQPKLINSLSGMNIEMVACGESHSCAITVSGDLYTWGNGSHNPGLLGHGSDVSYWTPKKVQGLLEGLEVSFVSCGPWHTALITSGGQLFTFGESAFGALGHGNLHGASTPMQVEGLKGLRTLRVACGVWHTAAIVEIAHDPSNAGPSDFSVSGKLFTWGDGNNGQLGHRDNKSRQVPELVASLVDRNFSRVACGQSLTVALTTSGRVYTMGSAAHGQLGSPMADGKTPTCILDNLAENFIEEISCGSHHVVVLTSRAEIFTWGKGKNGQLGHGDNDNRNIPTLVDSLRDKQVKSVVCGSNFTAVVCHHKSVSVTSNSACSGCHNPFNFRRKRHNCYNCGLVFCNACSSRKSMKASLAPSKNKPYRVCDDCYTKLQKAKDSPSSAKVPKIRNENTFLVSRDISEKESASPRPGFASVKPFIMSGGKTSRSNTRVETNDKWVLSPRNENAHRGSISSPKSPVSPNGTSKIFPFSLPSPRFVARATSPRPRKPSPLRSATTSPSKPLLRADVTLDESKHDRDSVSEETKYLKAQVEELASKNQVLVAELARTSDELKEARSLTADEAEKNRAAKEVIKSLSEQLKEMADRLHAEKPRASSSSHYNAGKQSTDSTSSNDLRGATDYNAGKQSTDAKRSNHLNDETSVSALRTESNDGPSASALSNGTRAQTQTQTSDRTIQYVPGVYITLTSKEGFNELKRIRFSRKRFTEQQAERWWAENGTKLCQRHNIRSR